VSDHPLLAKWLRRIIRRHERLPGWEHEPGSDERMSLYALLRARGEREEEEAER
jgi:hypothetical protein